jgi:hypothetical protein
MIESLAFKIQGKGMVVKKSGLFQVSERAGYMTFRKSFFLKPFL